MSGYAGSQLYAAWVWSGGTVLLHNSGYRTMTTGPEMELYEQTAGSDAYKTYIIGVRDNQVEMGFVAQAGGTAFVAALRDGVAGTLTVGPEGTASNTTKEVYPAFSMGLRRNQPYNNVVEYNVTFQLSAQPTYTVWS